MASFKHLSMVNLFPCIFVILITHRSYCHPHKRELNNFPQVLEILEDEQQEQLQQTEILQNISSALSQDDSSNILQKQSNNMAKVIEALASQSEILANISGSLNTLASGSSSLISTLANRLDILESLDTSASENLNLLANQSKLLEKMSISIDKLTKSSPITARDCVDIASQGPYVSGQYTIVPWDGLSPFKVYCDLESDDGGWIVIQKRFDGSIDFDRGWEEYKNGFGDLEGEFWLGLNKVFRLTRSGGPWQIRVELEDFTGRSAYAQYDNFAVGSEKTYFQLVSIGHYNGTAGDALTYHVGRGFTTKDRDNDSKSGVNCAESYGAFWHGGCGYAKLNGLYRTSGPEGIKWGKMHGDTLKSSTMKIKANR